MTNAEIAATLASLAQLLSAQKENPYKVRAYQRAATKIRDLPESVEELVRDDSDLTQFSGIGEAIASAVNEIVLAGSPSRLDLLRSQVPRRWPQPVPSARPHSSAASLQKARYLFDRNAEGKAGE